MNESLFFLIALMLSAHANLSNDGHGAVGFRWNALTHVIQRVYKGTPADRVGLRVGDKVIQVTDESNKHEVDGSTGSLVTLKVHRGSETLTFEIERAAESSIARK